MFRFLSIVGQPLAAAVAPLRTGFRTVAFAVALSVPAVLTGWALDAAAQAPDAKASGVRTLTWAELVPKDWDPSKAFRDEKIGLLIDGDPKSDAMLQRMREAWDNAPTNAALNGTNVRLPGYLVPLEANQGDTKEFLLVPYFGACIHSPPPPANQIIHVKLSQPAKGLRSMDAVWVSGTLKTARGDTSMGVSGYEMSGNAVERYVAPAR